MKNFFAFGLGTTFGSNLEGHFRKRLSPNLDRRKNKKLWLVAEIEGG
jgi:hypothetical protein